MCALAEKVFARTGDAILVTDSENLIVDPNPAFEQISGYSRQELIGRNPRCLCSVKHDAGFYTSIWQSLREAGDWEGGIWDRHKNGDICPKWLTKVENPAFLTKCVAMHRTTTPSAWPTMDERLANRKSKGYGKLSRYWRTSCSGKTSSTNRAALSALAAASPSLVHPSTHRPFDVPNSWDTSRGVCDGKGITNAASAGMPRSG